MFTSSISVDALKELTTGTDPVCGKEVKASDAVASAARDGKMLYFCSKDCEKAFNEDPDKYPAEVPAAE